MEEQNTNPLVSLSEGLADAVEAISPSVVRVRGGRRWPATGLVFAEGLVLTASHAVEHEEDLSVESNDGASLAATFVGRDTRNDLAVLKVEGLEATAATPAEGEARVGGLALAVGHSRQGVRVSMGIVSAAGSTQRGNRGDGRSSSRGRGGGRGGRWGGRPGGGRPGRGAVPERYVQSDAAPYPGLGGGALIDATGKVLGVVTTGMGGATLAVPADLAWSVANTIAEEGSVKRGYLGVYSQPVRLPKVNETGLNQDGGLLVVGVGEDTPALRSGIMVGDIIATLDGQPVETTDDLLSVLGSGMAGQGVAVQLMRGGELTKLEVTVGERN